MNQFLEFLKYAGPLAVLAGGAFAILKEVFRYGWRLAQVEKQSQTTAAAVENLQAIKESVAVMKSMVEELVRDKRQRNWGGPG